MKLTKISLKVFCLSLILIVQVGLGQATEQRLLDPNKGFFELHQLRTQPVVVGEDRLIEEVKSHANSINWNELREKCQREWDEKKARGFGPYNIGLFAIINLSSTTFPIQNYGVQPDTVSIFTRCWDKHGFDERIPLLRENTVFINVSTYRDVEGGPLFFICENALFLYSQSFNRVIVFVEYEDSYEEQVKENILQRYARYQKQPGDLLEQRIKCEPEITSYLEDPKKYRKSLMGKKSVFFQIVDIIIDRTKVADHKR